MSSLPTLYTELTKNPLDDSNDKPPINKPEEDAGHQQARINWLNSSITKEHINKIENQIVELFNDCVEKAVNHNTNQEMIIKNLVKINTLRKVLETYV